MKTKRLLSLLMTAALIVSLAPATLVPSVLAAPEYKIINSSTPMEVDKKSTWFTEGTTSFFEQNEDANRTICVNQTLSYGVEFGGYTGGYDAVRRCNVFYPGKSENDFTSWVGKYSLNGKKASEISKVYPAVNETSNYSGLIRFNTTLSSDDIVFIEKSNDSGEKRQTGKLYAVKPGKFVLYAYNDYQTDFVSYLYVTVQDHTWGDLTNKAWSEDGHTFTARATCSSCGRVDDVTCTVANGGITSQVVKAATCTTAGDTKYSATAFNKAAETKTVTGDISAKGHSWGTPAFTFSDDGKSATVVSTCGNDGNHKQTPTVTVTSKVTTQPTCTVKGTTTYTAKATFNVLGEKTATTTRQDVNAKGHAKGELYLAQEAADCTNNGVAFDVYKCANNCGAYVKADGTAVTATDWVTQKTGHNPASAWTNDPSTGKHYHVCQNGCGEKLNLTAHNWGGWTGEGTDRQRICNDCRAVQKCVHSWGALNFTFADDNTATVSRTCKNCNETQEENATVTPSVKTAATCTVKGTTTYTATYTEWDAKASKTKDVQDIDALGHVHDMTWHEDGNGKHYRDCKRTNCDGGTDAKGNGKRIQHSANFTYTVTKSPTAAEEGSLTGTCASCDLTHSVTLPALNETDYTKSTQSAPNCTANGIDHYTWKTRTYGEFSFDVTVPALGHNLTKTNQVDAKCETDGVNAYWTCGTCNKNFADEACTTEIANLDSWKTGEGKIDKLGHDWVKPQSTGSDEHVFSCSRSSCDETDTRVHTAPADKDANWNWLKVNNQWKASVSLTCPDCTYHETYAAQVTEASSTKRVATINIWGKTYTDTKNDSSWKGEVTTKLVPGEEEKTTSHTYLALKTVTAPAKNNANKAFQGWYEVKTDSNGTETFTRVSTKRSYTFFVTRSNIVLAPRYEGDSLVIEQVPEVYIEIEAGAPTCARITLRWSLPQGYTLEEAGLMRGAKKSYGPVAIDLITSGGAKHVSSIKRASGTYILNVSGATTGYYQNAIGYIDYKDANGNLCERMYTDVVFAQIQ